VRRVPVYEAGALLPAGEALVRRAPSKPSTKGRRGGPAWGK